MNAYNVTLFLHFAGMVALFVGYGLEWAASSLLRRATTGDEARAWLRIYRLSLPISGPGLLLLILSGGYLAALTGGMKQGWISATFLGIIFALAIGFMLILPRMRALRAALPEGAAPLSPTARTRVQDPVLVTLVRSRAFVALGIVYLMTLKPDTLVSSLVVLLVSLIIGALCAATTWFPTSTPAKS